MTYPSHRALPAFLAVYLPAVVWTLLVAAALLSPPVGLARGLRVPLYADKLVHFALFAVTALLWLRAGWVLRSGRVAASAAGGPRWRARLWTAAAAALAAALYGGLLELAQLRIASRSFEAADLAANGLGALAGAALWVTARRLGGLRGSLSPRADSVGHGS